VLKHSQILAGITIYRTSQILAHVKQNFCIYDAANSNSIISWNQYYISTDKCDNAITTKKWFYDSKVTHTIVYASSDGKACLANAQISPRLYHPNYPLGLKPGNNIMLLTMDESICDSRSQVSIAQQEVQFRVALAPLTLKAIPPTLREDLPSSQSLYRVIQISTGPGR
jgi:hypothetical protein